MTLYNDDLSKLRNGLIGSTGYVFRFKIGDRVEMWISDRIAIRGRVQDRAVRGTVNCYHVRWDVGRSMWIAEEDLQPDEAAQTPQSDSGLHDP
jgi:hypothetical protein